MQGTSARIYVIKAAIISLTLGYMCIDLWWLRGPMYNFLHKEKQKVEADAVVFGERITPAQVERHKAEMEALSGRPKPRTTVVMDLVRGSLLRLFTRYNDTLIPHDRAAAEQHVAQLSSRVGSDAAFAQQLISQGYTRQQFTDKLEARQRELAHLDRVLKPLTEVNDAAIETHYQQIKEELTIPANRPVKHIFIASLHRNEADTRQTAERIKSRLEAGEDFARLAAELSEDPRTAPHGGDLGTVYDDGHLPLPELNLFGDAALPADRPVLVRSKWGWHIIQAGPVTPARTPSLPECRETLRTAIISAQRELGTNRYFDISLKESFQEKRIQIHVK